MRRSFLCEMSISRKYLKCPETFCRYKRIYIKDHLTTKHIFTVYMVKYVYEYVLHSQSSRWR